MTDSHKKREILATDQRTNTMKHNPSSEVQSLSYSSTSLPSVEPEGSVLCHNISTLVHCSSWIQYLHSNTTSIRSSLVFPHLCLCLPRPSLPSNFRTQIIVSISLYVLPAPPITSFLILQSYKILESCKNYAAFSSLLVTKISLSVKREFYAYLLCLRDMHSPFRPLVMCL